MQRFRFCRRSRTSVAVDNRGTGAALTDRSAGVRALDVEKENMLLLNSIIRNKYLMK